MRQDVDSMSGGCVRAIAGDTRSSKQECTCQDEVEWPQSAAGVCSNGHTSQGEEEVPVHSILTRIHSVACRLCCNQPRDA